jgi:hypothetical protein
MSDNLKLPHEQNLQPMQFKTKLASPPILPALVSAAIAWSLRFYSALAAGSVNIQRKLLEELSPTTTDFAAVFAADYVVEARQAYMQLWRVRPIFPVGSAQRVRVEIFRAAQMRTAKSLAHLHAMAHCVQPECIWGSVVPAAAPALDGLVFLPHRVVWFPHPELFLMAQQRMQCTKFLSYWSV